MGESVTFGDWKLLPLHRWTIQSDLLLLMLFFQACLWLAGRKLVWLFSFADNGIWCKGLVSVSGWLIVDSNRKHWVKGTKLLIFLLRVSVQPSFVPGYFCETPWGRTGCDDVPVMDSVVTCSHSWRRLFSNREPTTTDYLTQIRLMEGGSVIVPST